MPVNATSKAALPFKPNRLRASLRSDWGFSKIDTDFFVDQAVGRQIRNLEADLSENPPDLIEPDRFPIDIARWMRLSQRSSPLSGGAISVRPGASDQHVAFGPYVTLPKGSYRFVMEIEKAPGGLFWRRAAPIVIEVATADACFAQAGEDHGFKRNRRVRFETNFQIEATAVKDVEFRVWADRRSAFDILSMRLERC